MLVLHIGEEIVNQLALFLKNPLSFEFLNSYVSSIDNIIPKTKPFKNSPFDLYSYLAVFFPKHSLPFQSLSSDFFSNGFGYKKFDLYCLIYI